MQEVQKMKILFFDTKSYDKESFDKQVVNYPDIEIEYLKTDLTPKTAPWLRVMTQYAPL